MTEERITRTETAEGETHTHTTVIKDSSEGGSKSWLFLVILLIAVVGGIYVFTQMGGAEVAKDTAIADAAEQVGDAATKVGDAAEEAADTVTGGE
ncbi:hypothetical protein GCM10023115_18850 [Pontixanthobacter gangjinensis]|uniref:Uncharacterized protein n=1 Tax=Pontixanthobacter gangjinensis TaxID=1028742 RepID=A0A6I4SN49_9SPHN|nr:hypothetical protein [Pontixanthobacter gangjinensis]MXO57134.1 hypothetical protein [Pontixanthobacter gangjinensis]